MSKHLLWLSMFLLLGHNTYAQDTPEIGAQVYIEPGQSISQIQRWFAVLEEHDMTVCRIRMDETHMLRSDGTWNFELYDAAFKAAEKHKVKVFATLFPADDGEGVGGFKFPRDKTHQASIARYIEKVVQHFKGYPSLYGWVLQNEPGVGGVIPKGAYTEDAWADWQKRNPFLQETDGYMQEDFSEPEFLREHTTAYLQWIADEIDKYDPGRHLHVNNHKLFVTLPEYQFPEWRDILTSFGASMHPSWHFGYFNRDQYPVAMGANNDIIRAGAGHKPFWVTELQGGNNSYSGFNPMTPGKHEVAQWLWSSLFSGAEGIIFWCLNPRKAGLEAGEWSLLDFLDEPTDRLETSAEIARWLKASPEFANAAPQLAPVHILYNRESMYLQRTREMRNTAVQQYYDGRLPGATIKSVLAHYEALSEQGVSANLKAMDDFDWAEMGKSGEAVIIPHQIVLPRRHWEGVEQFVANGGRLLVTGLSAHFDEYGQNIMTEGFPLKEAFGGQVREFRVKGAEFMLDLQPDPVPAHLWQGHLAPGDAKAFSVANDGLILSVEHEFGNGEVLWIPSPLGLAAWQKDNEPLVNLLNRWLGVSIEKVARLANHESGVTMKAKHSDAGIYTLLINKNLTAKTVELVLPRALQGRIVYDLEGAVLDGAKVTLPPDACTVIEWKP